MFDLKNKYSANPCKYSSTYNTKSLLKPDLTDIDLSQSQIVWLRQPPPPYPTEVLSFNLNKLTYKCTPLDFQCSIICQILALQTASILKTHHYGPIQSFLYTHPNNNKEFRVNLLLFQQYKKCLFTIDPIPTLINLQNNNKYPLTQQDINSIYLLDQQINAQSHQQSDHIDPGRLSNSSLNDSSILITKKQKKTLVVGNLLQRLILLKLFHEIPNGIYCHSLEILQVIFYDQMSCNMALLALNRFKYQKKQASMISKSMLNTMQYSSVTNVMKKSNDSFTNLKTLKNSQLQSRSSNDESFHSTSKKQFLPLAMLKNLKKSPKQSINSVQQSVESRNSNHLNHSHLAPEKKEYKLISSLFQNQSKETLHHPEYHSKISIKHPKVSFLSTDINSTKQARQHKVSFPETPNTQNLKSSQLIVKPNEFKSCLSLRRSQEQIKTPRMDADDSVNHSIKVPIKKKSISVIEDPDENEEQIKYVNQFENLLFQVDGNQNKEEQLCLNDSFAKMEEEEEKQISKFTESQKQKILPDQINTKQEQKQNLHSTIPSFLTNKSGENLQILKQTLQRVLHENSQLKKKNEQLTKQISEISMIGGKKNDIERYESEIEKMKQIKQSLIQEIQDLKMSAISSKNLSQHHQSILNQSPQKIIIPKASFHQTDPKKIQKNDFYNQNYLGSPPRESKHANEPVFKINQPSSPSFIGRRSQQHKSSSFIIKECEQPNNANIKNDIINSGQNKFWRPQNDSNYLKFRNNQSYSYKTSESFKFDENKGQKQYFQKP